MRRVGVLTTAAHAMMLLGDVRQGQEMCERASHRYRMRQWQSAEDVGQLLKLGAVGLAVVSALGQRAHLLDELKDLFTLVNAQRVASSSPSSRTSSRSALCGSTAATCLPARCLGPGSARDAALRRTATSSPADRATIRV